MGLTKEARDGLPDDHFAVPGKRKLPIHDVTHTRLAWDMVDRTQGLSPAERKAARERILHRANDLGVSTKDWHVEAELEFHAMAIEMPAEDGHPNRKPFTGVLTRVGKPSDEAPGGATGKRVLIPTEVAEAALGTLLGMSVDTDPDGSFNGHDPQYKIGLITEAFVDGDALKISGFFYANDFPDLWQKIRAEKHLLGFSYECKVRIRDPEADIWTIDRCVFTGAALLYKEKAAYHSTSLAAQANLETEMSKEILDAIAALSAKADATAAAVAAVTKDVTELKAGKGSSLAGPIVDQVEPHVKACMAAADGMENAGFGSGPQSHAAAIRRVGAHALQCAVAGRIPHIYRDHSYLGGDGVEAGKEEAAKALAAAVAKALEPVNAELKAAQDKAAAQETQIADLKAKAVAAVEPPVRKTSADLTALLAKTGIKPEDAGKLTLADADKALQAAGITGRAAIQAKLTMRANGVLNS